MFRRDDHDRNWSTAQDAFGDAADERAPQSRSTVTADHDEYRPKAAGRAHDFVNGIALRDPRRHVHTTAYSAKRFGDDCFTIPLNLLEAAGKKLGVAAAHESCICQTDDVAENDFGVKVVGELDGGVDRVKGSVGPVERYEDLHDAAPVASGESNAFVLTVKTGIGALRRTPSATLPMIKRFNPERPCVPRTIVSALIRLA